MFLPDRRHSSGLLNRAAHDGSVAAPFDPQSLSPVGWYDPSDLSSMRQGSTAGSSAAAVDSEVGYLADKSGNGWHATQATSSKRPILRQSGSVYWLEFDGVEDALGTSTTFISQPITAFVAGEVSSSAPALSRMFDGAPRVMIGRQNGDMLAFAGSLGVQSGQSFGTGDKVWSARFDGASSTFRKDSVQIASGNPGSNGLTGLVIGANNISGGESLGGKIHGLIIVAGTIADMVPAEQYLAGKQGRSI